MSRKLHVLVGTAKGAFIYRSDLSRKHWTVEGPILPGWEVTTLLPDERAGPRLFAGTTNYVYGATIRVSKDLGKTWNQVEAGPAYGNGNGGDAKLNRIWQLVPGHASEPEMLYAGVDEAGLFVSRDGGVSWSHVDTLRNHPTGKHWFPGNGGLCLHTILVDRYNAQKVWVGISAVGVFRTDDGGTTWKTCNEGLPRVVTDAPGAEVGRCVHRMVLDPEKPDTLYQQFHGGVFRSRDGAASWESIEHGLPGNFGFPMVVTANGDLFVVPMQSDEIRLVPDGRLRVYRSKDRGSNWDATSAGLPQADCHVGVLRDAMAVDSLDPAGIYFGTTMGQMFASSNGGEAWDRLPGHLPRILSVRTWLLD